MRATVFSATANGMVQIPGSKSHTIRALLLASAARGTSILYNYLDSADTRSCINACRALGAEISVEKKQITVHSPGIPADRAAGTIDVGNSGTTLYLASGMAALGGRPVLFTGDEQIKRRPFGPLLQALTDLGAETKSVYGNGAAPAEIRGPLKGGETSIECPTSQYLSALLLCAPLIGKKGTDVKTVIHVPLLFEEPYVEITLRWLFKQGAFFTRDGYRRFEIPGGQRYTPFTESIPGDFSTASFFICAAAVTGGRVILRGLDLDDPQGDKEVLEMVRQMGCTVEVADLPEIIVTGPDKRKGKTLRGIEIDMNGTPDALPIMAVTACYAEGETRLFNVPQAREKETDRISVMREELTKMGAEIEELTDGLVIKKSSLRGCTVDGHGDHRVVMALAVAALGAYGPTTIDSAEAAEVTVPEFFSLLRALGARVDLT